MPQPLRTPTVTAVGVLCLAFYYSVVYRPLARQAAALDSPLTESWNRFVAASTSSLACAGLTLTNAAGRLERLQHALVNLETAQRGVQTILELSPDVVAHMREPFQILDFQNERLRVSEQVGRLAKEAKVTVDPAVTLGLPEYSVDLASPQLLWPRLHFSHQLLLTAVQARVGTIKALCQLPPSSSRGEERSDSSATVSMRVELTGSAEALQVFLSALPLRAQDLAHVGLGGTLTNKPVFFLEQVLMRKLAPEQPKDAQLELVVSGWVPPGKQR